VKGHHAGLPAVIGLGLQQAATGRQGVTGNGLRSFCNVAVRRKIDDERRGPPAHLEIPFKRKLIIGGNHAVSPDAEVARQFACRGQRTAAGKGTPLDQAAKLAVDLAMQIDTTVRIESDGLNRKSRAHDWFLKIVTIWL